MLSFGRVPDEVLAGLGARARRVVGMNSSRHVVQWARAALHSAGLNHCVLQQGELTALPQPAHGFDVEPVRGVLLGAVPLSVEAPYETTDGIPGIYRALLMPFTTDGNGIDVVFGVVSWRETARAGERPDAARIVPIRS